MQFQLTYKDFNDYVLRQNGLRPDNDVIDVGSVQDHFELVQRGISNNNSKEQIILIQECFTESDSIHKVNKIFILDG